MDSSSPVLLLIFKQWILFISWESICTLSLDTFKITKVNNLNFRIQSQRSLFEAHVEKSRHAGRDGGHGGAADDRSSDVAAGRRRMALVTVTRASLKIVHFWVSAISSGTKYFWMRFIRGRQCCCFTFGSWQNRWDEEMTLDVSDGPALARFDGWCRRRLSLCLKRPSFYCLIHFYKRCVSSLAHMSVTTFFIPG